MNDPGGCKSMKCVDMKDGVCHYPGDICKYREDEYGIEYDSELMGFIRDVTLCLQQHANYNAKKLEPMFQRAYRLYVKYDVENL